ncbi:MAG: hypothetical protein K2I98_02755 [Prevotella sp.]|nr:hypothetical protein [Prevotella sp.]
MKQKSIFLSLLTMVMVAMLSAGFVACSSDDDDDDSGSNSVVVGTWSGWDNGERLTLTFKGDGTGVGTRSWPDGGSESTKFSYKMNGKSEGVITDKWYNDSYGEYETDYYYFKIEGKKMYLDADGFEWILTKE